MSMIADIPRAADATIRLRMAAAVILILAVAFLLQIHVWVMNPDTSWLMTVVERVSAGDRLYVDVIDNNPPVSIWLYMPPVAFAELAGVSPESATILYTLLICGLGVGSFIWIARAGRLVSERALVPLGLALLAMSTILVGNILSERDHLGVVLVLPLLALAAWRAGGMTTPRNRHWIVAGLAGSAIALVKPYYILVILAAAAYVVTRRRDWRAIFLPEFLLAALITTAYAALAWFAYPVFFEELLPLLRDTYLAFRWPFAILAYLVLPWFILPLATRMLSLRGGRSDLAGVLFWAGLMSVIPYFIQGKGWSYHFYAAVFLGSACLLVMAAEIVRKTGRRLAVEAVVIAVLATLVAHYRYMPVNQAEAANLAVKAQGLVNQPTVGILSGDIGVGHPLTRLIGGRFIEPYCSDWIGTYTLRMENRASLAGDTAKVAYYQDMRGRYFVEKLARLAAAPPDVLVVPLDDRLVDMMLGQYGFDALLARYDRIAQDGPIVLYKLRKS